MDPKDSIEPPIFTGGGLAGRVWAIRFGHGAGTRDLALRILAVLAVSALPLFILTARDGTLNGGVELPLLQDLRMLARTFLVVPLLIFISSRLEAIVGAVVSYAKHTLVTPEGWRTRMEPSVRRMRALCQSRWLDALFLLLALAAELPLLFGPEARRQMSGADTWIAPGIGAASSISAAGWWYALVTTPLVLFILLRWVFRYSNWVWFLWQLSRVQLRLVPTHPDHSGGIAILQTAQRVFNVLFVALGIIISAQLTQLAVHQRITQAAIQSHAIVYVLIALALTMLPFTFYIGQLARAKRAALIEYGNLGALLTRRFHQQWVEGRPASGEAAGDVVDPSVLADYATTYTYVEKLRMLPVGVSDVLAIAVPVAATFIPALVAQLSLVEIVQRLVQMLM